MKQTFSLCWRFEKIPVKPIPHWNYTWKQTRRDAPKSLYTCLYDKLPIQYIWLNDWSNMSSSITLICSFRISHQILCTTFRKHSMNLILKLFVFGFRLVELYLQVEQKFAILGDFAKLFKGFIIIGKIWKINTVCLEISSTNKLKWSSLSKLYFGSYKRKHAKKRLREKFETALTP